VHELLGREVRAADGRRIGRVYDLAADKRGDELCVTGLLVGPSAWLERFGWTKRPHGRTVPWEDIASLQPAIVLRPDAES
jgi:sporulation protein YlmC with PRC-barrel domain